MSGQFRDRARVRYTGRFVGNSNNSNNNNNKNSKHHQLQPREKKINKSVSLFFSINSMLNSLKVGGEEEVEDEGKKEEEEEELQRKRKQQQTY